MLWILLVASGLIAYGVTKLSIILSLRCGVLDLPNLRSSHTQPVPRMGGIGILAGFFICLAVLAGLEGLGVMREGILTRDVLLFVIAGAGMAIAGFCDDLYRLNPATKFLMQFVLAGLLIGLGARLESLAFPGLKPLALGFLAIPVTLLWLTGFANVFNFMDGINGMAGGTGVVFSGLFLIVAGRQGNQDIAAMAVLLGGSCLGFLLHNFPQARTFMGDTGSLFLGMVFALLVVRLGQRSHDPAALVALVLGTSVYLWDSGFTLLRRLKRAENIFRAHRSHLYQRLVQAGLTHVKVTGLYLALHTLLGTLGLAYLGSSETGRLWILTFAALVLACFTYSVYRVERGASGSRPQGDGKAPDAANLQRSTGR